MIRNRLLLKTLAIFFIVEMLMTTVLPTVSWALTSGPTAPEATSFEPVDTTDMVNLVTGDFVYNLPLLDVPGPAGGYPLALSYHAGIQPGEEASWVGLGWTLNPGALTRGVNGFADDFKEINTVDRVYWEGGIRKTYSLGVSVGFAGMASVGLNVAYSKDTYQGVAMGVSLNGGFQFGGMQYGASFGVSPYGDPTIGLSAGGVGGASISVGTDLQSLSVSGSSGGSSVGVSTNFRSVDLSMSLGSSIASSDMGVRLVKGTGPGSVNNSKTGNITTQSGNVGLVIPIAAVTISLGYNYTRYFIDETEKVVTNGSLYNPMSPVLNFDTRAYDTYSLLSPEPTGEQDPNLTAGATYFNYDDYNVNAQGIFGNIRPFHFKGLAVRQNKKKDNVYEIKQYAFEEGDYRHDQVEYRFINDFSNRNLNENGAWSTGGAFLQASYGTSVTGETGNDGIQENHLAGSRHVEWYTNAQILGDDESKRPFADGLIDCIATGFDRNTAPPEQIGAFKITSESGVTYHFALPVYAYDEYQYSENIRKTDGLTYNEFKKPDKYAYTWYLTAVTGPDYVDRGGLDGAPNNKIDEADWGYCVDFQYGRWTENYAWRTPGSGYFEDVDLNFKNYSSGKKELYFLDAIKTKTHTALFVKEIRVDAKSSAYAYNLQKKSDLGFIPSNFSETITKTVFASNFCHPASLRPQDYVSTSTSVSHKTHPVSTLKLKKIFLFENAVLENEVFQHNNILNVGELKTEGDLNEFNITFTKVVTTQEAWYRCKEDNFLPSNSCECVDSEDDSDEEPDDFIKVTASDSESAPVTIPLHTPDNVLDMADITGITTQIKNATRVIDFETSYSLAPETPNSFEHPDLYTLNPPTSDAAPGFIYRGKLTLDKLHFSGKGTDSDLIPPIAFTYDYSSPEAGSGVLTSSLANSVFVLSGAGSDLEIGDIIKFSAGGNCYGLVESENGNEHNIRILGKVLPQLQSINWHKTKNPPYNRNHYDMWGLYKPDYNDPNQRSDNRYTTPISVRSVDAWSLRQIRTSLGSTITMDYEADSYHKSVLQNGHALRFIEAEYLSDVPGHANTRNFRFHVATEGKDLRDIYSPNSWIQFVLPYTYWEWEGNTFVRKVAFTTTGLINVVNEKTLDVEVNISFPGTEQHPNGFVGGTIFYDTNYENLGGGYRVRAISIKDPLRSSSKSVYYEYHKDGVTTGVTSYEPNIVEKMNSNFGDEEISILTRSKNFSRFENILQCAREVPAPGVMYETVRVKENITVDNITTDAPSYSEYTFQVLHENMVGFQVLSNNSSLINSTYDGIAFNWLRKKNIALKDYTQFIGKLKSVTAYDQDGNKISETVNQYLHDLIPNYESKTLSQISTEYAALMDDYSQQGVVHESTWAGRFIKNTTSHELYGIISQRQAFPAVQIGVKSTNFKTGVSTETQTLEFDFYSGRVVKSLTVDMAGKSYVTEMIPAYRKYPGMGLALDGGMNMLTQEAGAFVYRIDPNNNNLPSALVSASIQTWSGETPIYGQPELSDAVTLEVGIKDNIDGLYPATDNAQVTKLRVGEHIAFLISGNKYTAKVVGANSTTGWAYDLNIIGSEPEISSPIMVTAKRISAYRKHRNISFIGNNEQALLDDGLYPLTTSQLPSFSAWEHGQSVPSGWQKNSEIHKYDIYSHALEASDMNDHFAAVKTSSDQTRVLATAVNSYHAEFAYSGAEDKALAGTYGGGVSKGNGVEVISQCTADAETGCNLDYTTTHTGHKALQLTNASHKAFQYSFSTPDANARYHASVWMNSEAGRLYYSINGLTTSSPGIPVPSKKSGAWYLVEVDIPVSAANSMINVWCSTTGTVCNFDDFRIFPADGSMISYVYNKWGEVSHILNGNNLFTEYRYDKSGRLKETFQETLTYGNVKTGEIKYHYAGQEDLEH